MRLDMMKNEWLLNKKNYFQDIVGKQINSTQYEE